MELRIFPFFLCNHNPRCPLSEKLHKTSGETTFSRMDQLLNAKVILLDLVVKQVRGWMINNSKITASISRVVYYEDTKLL